MASTTPRTRTHTVTDTETTFTSKGVSVVIGQGYPHYQAYVLFTQLVQLVPEDAHAQRLRKPAYLSVPDEVLNFVTDTKTTFSAKGVSVVIGPGYPHYQAYELFMQLKDLPSLPVYDEQHTVSERPPPAMLSEEHHHKWNFVMASRLAANKALKKAFAILLEDEACAEPYESAYLQAHQHIESYNLLYKNLPHAIRNHWPGEPYPKDILPQPTYSMF